ncbi:MAG: triose-phosphate isomerase [Kosmotogaceae bacterium]|nr:triose-phosphate isomerase [Kosmotogaceae bacterium]
MSKTLTLKDIDLRGKRVLVRVDFNVPLNKETGEVSDDTRIVAALPTINEVIERGGKAILVSHLGRPKGKRDPKYSLERVAERLQSLIGKPVSFVADCVGEDVEKAVSKMNNGDILLLENVRFYSEEEKNDPDFSRRLSSIADIHVNDAFGTAHRGHASNVGVASYLTSVPGFLMQKEIEMLGMAIENPEHPYVVILGGAKVSDKIGVITNLLEKADRILIGGAMMFTFLKAQGRSVGDSLVEEDKIDLAREILQKAKEKNVEFVLPVDTVVAKEIAAGSESKVVDLEEGVPAGWKGLDIGPSTIDLFNEKLTDAKTVVWNGPMGVFEIDDFAKGTESVAKTLASLNKAVTIIGGGDSAAAINKFGLAEKVSHVSTGGGASLEMLEGKEMPGIKSLSIEGGKKKRRLMVAGNWKMNKSPNEARMFAGFLASSIGNENTVDVVVFPTSLSVAGVSDILKDTSIKVGVQNIFPADSGAFTGEISASMLSDLFVEYVLVGHSERRHIFGETSELTGEKIKSVLKHGFTPVFCVGETLEEREAGRMKEVLEDQIRKGFSGLGKSELEHTIIAYEPVWAIGTGVVASPEQADEAMKFIRDLIASLYDVDLSETVRILYGGSIKPENFESLISMENIDGGLVGGASLQESFVQLVAIADNHA